MSEIKPEYALESDLDDMIMLLQELFEQESDFKPNPSQQKQGLSMILHNSASGQLFVLRYADRVIGMANLLFTISTAMGDKVAILEDLIISKAYRGKGLGKILLNHSIDWLKDKGFKRITLLTDSDNNRARALYEQEGFLCSDMVTFRLEL